jgi:hypothetical protein
MRSHQRLISIVSDRQSVTDYRDQPFKVLGGRLALNHSLIALIISAYSAARPKCAIRAAMSSQLAACSLAFCSFRTRSSKQTRFSTA